MDTSGLAVFRGSLLWILPVVQVFRGSVLGYCKYCQDYVRWYCSHSEYSQYHKLSICPVYEVYFGHLCTVLITSCPLFFRKHSQMVPRAEVGENYFRWGQLEYLEYRQYFEIMYCEYSQYFEVLYCGYCLYSKYSGVRYCGCCPYWGFCTAHTPSNSSSWTFITAHTLSTRSI